MQVEWYGQAAFRLSDGETTLFVDPFGDIGDSLRWDYPAIAGVEADLLLVTHEHRDHNAVEAIGGEPLVLRSRAGRFESPIGEVVGVASEHDEVAGTWRGANVLYVFTFAGVRVAHLGDLGQAALRPEQLAALGQVELLFAPVGGGPTIGAEQATEIGRQLGARAIVPMHYRTARIDFLEPVDDFVAQAVRVARLDAPAFDWDALPSGEGALVVVPAAP